VAPIPILPLAATPPGLFTGDPTMGFNSALKMSYQPNITGASQADGTKPVAWLGQYNPASSYMGRSGTYNWTDNYNHAARSEIASQFPVQCDGQNAYVGYSADDARSPTRAQLFHLPRSETGSLSLGALQHAQVHPSSGLGKGYNPSRMPAYAVGNSYVDPLVLCSDPDGFPDWNTAVSGDFFKFHCDLSFVLNRKLWDKYYFSAVPASGPPSFPLPNPRHTLHDPKNVGASGLASSLQNVDTAAAHLLVEGAFNINSTSREAWRALLASTRKAPVIQQDGRSADVGGQNTPLARTSYPLEGAVKATTTISTDASEVYNGFRSLTDPQLDALAIQIVKQVKERAAAGNYGPCRSLADFVNRRPSAVTQAFQLKGPLQAAIDATTLNGTPGVISPTTTPMIASVGSELNEIRTGTRHLYSMVQPGYSVTQCRFQYGIVPLAAAVPGYLTQADLLQVLGPLLAARSDTFRIRTYGEAIDPANPSSGRARAWCEAIVQRVPDYVDANLAPETDLATVTSPTKDLGRRFEVVSFRWLSPSEL
jgi:hypothetical protein